MKRNGMKSFLLTLIIIILAMTFTGCSSIDGISGMEGLLSNSEGLDLGGEVEGLTPGSTDEETNSEGEDVIPTLSPDGVSQAAGQEDVYDDRKEGGGDSNSTPSPIEGTVGETPGSAGASPEPSVGQTTEPSVGQTTEPSVGQSAAPSVGQSAEPSTSASPAATTAPATEPTTAPTEPTSSPGAAQTSAPAGQVSGGESLNDLIATYYGPDNVNGVQGGNDNVLIQGGAGYTAEELKQMKVQKFCALSTDLLQKKMMGKIIEVTGPKSSMQFVVVDCLPSRSYGIDIQGLSNFEAIGGTEAAGTCKVSIKVVGDCGVPTSNPLYK